MLFLSTVINYVDRQALSVLIPTLRTELQLTTEQYYQITSWFLIAYTVGQLVAGMWVDKIGAKLGFAIFIGVWSLAAGLHAWAAGAMSLLMFRMLLGLAEAGNWPAGGRVVARWFPQEKRAFAMAIFDGGSAIGAIIAVPLIAFVASHLGWREAFVITGALGFIWLAIWLVVYDQPDKHRWLSEEDRILAISSTGGVQKNHKGFGGALKQIITTRPLWGLVFTRFFATPIWWFYVFSLPDYLSMSRGFSLKDIGMYAWVPYLTVDLGKMTGGAISDRLLSRKVSATLARKSVMLTGACLMCASILVVGADTPASAIAWVCVATFGFGMWSANILALHADFFPASTMGSAVGFTGMAASLSGAGFSYIIGLIVAKQGYGPVFLLTGGLAVAASCCLIFLVGRVKRIDETAAA